MIFGSSDRVPASWRSAVYSLHQATALERAAWSEGERWNLADAASPGSSGGADISV